MAKVKLMSIDDEKLNEIIDRTIKKYTDAVQQQKNEKKEFTYHNTKLLLDNYRRFKLYIEHAVQSLEDICANDSELLNSEIFRIFGMRDEDKKLMSIQKSVTITSMLMEHVDRMLEVYRKSCESSPSIVVQRRWQVVERMYLREQRMTTTQIAEEFNLEPRNIREDAKRAREDLVALFFGIETILSKFSE